MSKLLFSLLGISAAFATFADKVSDDGPCGDVSGLADPLRPQLHLTAKRGWINDPNGLSFRNGEWHVFCQHNPKGVQWGNMSWYHFVSRDLVRWTPLTDVITPDSQGAMFSGSAVTDAGNTAGFGKDAHVLVYTAMSDAGRGSQCLAWSQDGRNYTKYEGNPVLPNIAGGQDRDPRVFWHTPSGRWVMALYFAKDGACTLGIFTSADLKKWELASEMSGGAPAERTGWLYECPGLEEIRIEGEGRTAWVVWGADTLWYQVGEFDGRRFTPLAPRVEGGVQMPAGRDRGGNCPFYAAQTFTGTSRCIWVPWFRNEYRKGAAYCHCLGIPQELTLRRTADGLRLVRRPVREFAQLRAGDAVPLEKFDGELAEVSLACTLDRSGRAAFDLRGLKLAYDAAAGTLSAGERYVVKWPVTDGRFAITVFLDRGCAEVFSADGLRMMPIPDRPIDPANRRLKVLECHGATDCAFKAWKLNSIWRPLSLFAAAPSLSVVKDGKAQAEIVLGSDVLAPRVPNQAEAHQWAAEELQRWIAEITGAYVPIVRRDRPVGAKVRIVLQAQNAKKLFPKDWKAIGASDGYAIRTREADGVTEIHLFGTCPRGTLNAAFAFLEANSDIIWPRPDPAFEAVYSKSPDFTAKATDVLDVPVSRFRYRQWSGHGDFSNCRQADWSARNRENDIGRGLARHATMMANGGGGHGMMKYANAAANFEKHPEWFTLFDGQRTPKTWWVCFCGDPEGLSDEFVKNIRLELDRRYPGVDPKNVKVDFFNISGADSWNVCQCEACTKPFVCEDGTVVDPQDPAFRSAQCFTFMNKIARKLRRTHPNVVLGNYAYYITETPPPFRLDPNIRIQFCPYGENMKAPLDDPKANSYPARLLKAWGKACDKVCYRSYSGCGMNFPRQTEYIVQSNLLACLRQPLPIREFKDESHADLMRNGRGGDCIQWNMCAMECWVNNRLWWNPRQDLEALRRQFVTRAYQEAAEPMMAYHNLLRDAYYSDRLSSAYNSINPVAYTSHYIVEKGHADRLLALLDEALAKVKNPVSREMIRRHREFFGKWIAEAKDKVCVSMTVPYSDAKDLATAFDSDVWEKAGTTGDFVSASEGREGRGKKPMFRTTARILHDRTAFYVKFDCYAPDMANLKVSQLKPGQAPGTSASPRGDIVEFYFANADEGVYWTSIMDAGNPGEPEKDCIYFARLSDSSWKGGWTRQVKRYDDRWTMIVRVPFDSMGLAAAQNFRVLFQAIRQKYYNPKARDFSSWNGGWVHAVDDFGELKLGL